MSFLIPEGFEAINRLWLLLLIPLIVGLYIFAMTRKDRRGMRFTNTSMLGAVIPKQSPWRRHLSLALSLLSLITLTMAFARPTQQVDVPRERATIIVVLDVSLSMKAVDVAPSRFEAAQTAAETFVLSLPEKFNVSLVSLSGNSRVVVPPTLDHQLVARSVQTLKLEESTAIGEGLAAAMQALQQAPGDKNDPRSVAPGAIVLLSDGESTAGRAPQQVAQEVAKAKVPIYTIAYGTENGFVDVDGKRQLVPPDKKTMQDLARMTQGQYFDADNAEELKVVYTKIGSEVGSEKATRQVTARYAGFGLVFAVLAAVGAILLGSRRA